MSRLQENQKLPTDVKHGQYDPKKLPLESLKGYDLNSGEKVQAPYFFDDEGFLCINLETDVIVGDYYGEFSGDCQNIIEDVENWAKENGGYWEWINPGAIMFVK